MLIRFNVKNFLSFSEKEDGTSEEFSMLAGKVRKKEEHIYKDDNIKLIKFAAIYGANAAGKSNLVKAIDFMKKTVINGLSSGHTDKYCKVEPSNKNQNSYFEIEVNLNGRYYSYGFEVLLSESKFISEWLVELKADNRERLIFSRNILKGNFELGQLLKSKNALKENLNIYLEDVKEDSSVLFLSLMNQHKKGFYHRYEEASILKDVYLWLYNGLAVYYPDNPISNYSYLENAQNVEEICEMISAFGTGITNYEVVEVPIDEFTKLLPKPIIEEIFETLEKKSIDLQNEEEDIKTGVIMRSSKNFFILEINKESELICKTIRFSHGKKNVLFDLKEESDGTVRILDLIEILFATGNKTFVVDELDRCLHPSLTYKFVEAFLEKISKSNIQLIVTTHESRLLDFELLRRDEIWFIDKSESGKSNIYSLEEYNERFDKKIDKAYLEGRYGGVPVFSTIFPIEE